MMRARATSTGPAPVHAGFTLIEMIVIVALIGLMTAIIAPVWRVSPIRRVENQAHVLAGHLELARTDALGERRMLRVTFDPVASTYTAYVDHDEDDAITVAAAEITAFPAFGVQSLDDFVSFGRGSASAVPGDTGSGAVTLPNGRLDLNQQGLPTPWGAMGTIYLVHATDNSAVAAISISSAGSFKAWRWWPDPGEWR